MNSQHVQVATLVLSGQKPGQIAGQLGISIKALETIRKNKSYRRIESDLAGRMLDAAGSELQGLAIEAVEKLRSIIRIPARNLRGKNGLERKIADPLLLREQRQTALAVLQLATQIAEKQADSAESQALDARLLIDTDHD